MASVVIIHNQLLTLNLKKRTKTQTRCSRNIIELVPRVYFQALPCSNTPLWMYSSYIWHLFFRIWHFSHFLVVNREIILLFSPRQTSISINQSNSINHSCSWWCAICQLTETNCRCGHRLSLGREWKFIEIRFKASLKTRWKHIVKIIIPMIPSLDQLLTCFLAAGLTLSSQCHQYSEDCHNPATEHHTGLYVKVRHLGLVV